MVAECCCGKLTVKVRDKPVRHGVCHCKDCKKRTGSAFGISAYYKKEQVVNIKGEACCYQLTNPADGSDQQRFFCKTCGSTVYWCVSTFPELIGVAGGCFVEPPLGTPTYSVSKESKWCWINLPRKMEEHT